MSIVGVPIAASFYSICGCGLGGSLGALTSAVQALSSVTSSLAPAR